MQIKCIGNRRIDVINDGNTISLKLTLKGNYLATLVLEKDEAIKLVGELNGVIRFNRSTE